MFQVYDEDFGSDGLDYRICFTFGNQFHSADQAFEYANEIALALGFNLVRSSNKALSRRVNDVRQHYFACDRSGEPRIKNKILKFATSSKKCGCKVWLKAIQSLCGNYWYLGVGPVGIHNHSLTVYDDGDRRRSRLTEEEKEYVYSSLKAHVQPAQILEGLHERAPDKARPSRRTIYNMGARMRAKAREGRNAVEQMFKLAADAQYVRYFFEDEFTQVVERIFMAHPEAVKMYRSYFGVVLIDATYKTNRYDMKFVEMVGITPVGNSFLIAYALVRNEDTESYVWILEKLRTLLSDDISPPVIVTDRELGLLDAIPRVFPTCYILLCTWHISNCVERRALKVLRDATIVSTFKHVYWEPLLYANTVHDMSSHWKRLKSRWNVLAQYVGKVWIEKHLNKWAHAYTNNVLHFGTTTTSRVEGLHSALKNSLNSSTGALDGIWERTHQYLGRQHSNIKHQLEFSRTRASNVTSPIFKKLRRVVSRYVLDMLEGELVRMQNLAADDRVEEDCYCVLQTSRGIPCACKLWEIVRRNGRVLPSDVHVFWRTLVYSGEEAVPESDEFTLDGLVDQMRASDPTMLRHYIEVIQNALHEDELGLVEPSPNPKPPKRRGTGRELIGVEHARIECRRRKSSDDTSTPKKSSKTTNTSTPSKSGNTSTPQKSGMTSGTQSSAGTWDAEIDGPLEDNYMVGIFYYLSSVIVFMRPFIQGWYDPVGDGHCGFRVMSHAERGVEDHFSRQRLQLVNEIERPLYAYIYGEQRGLTAAKHRIGTTSRAPVGQEHWCWDIDFFAFATIHNWAVCVLSSENPLKNMTFMPLYCSMPGVRAPFGVVWIFNTGNHWIRLRMTDGCPMPPINMLWLPDDSVQHYRGIFVDRFLIWQQWFAQLFPNM